MAARLRMKVFRPALIAVGLLLLSSYVYCEANTGMGAIDGIKQKASLLVNSTKDSVSSVASDVKEKITESANATKQAVSSSVESAKEKVIDKAEAAVKSVLPTEDNSTVFFEEFPDLGNFTNAGPWYGLTRPFPLPKSPKEIDIHVYLYTRKDLENRYSVQLRPDISLDDSDFDSKRGRTCFLTHGFASDGNSSWVMDLKNAYLGKKDANFFIVDWGQGASSLNYFQVAANTRVVGAELSRFVRYLINNYNLAPQNIHLLGHSLGAQVSAYIGKSIPDISHLTAFDPAQPGFEGQAEEVRLSKGDAKFVEIIHSNGKPFIPYLGFGYINAAGDVDYFMNGGKAQPGCTAESNQTISEISDLTKFTMDALSNWISCSHGRSYQYYIEAVSSNNCAFWGLSVGNSSELLDIETLNEAHPIMNQLRKCTLKDCVPMGLESKKYRASGMFNVVTNPESPYCVNDTELRKLLLQYNAEGSGSSSIFGGDSALHVSLFVGLIFALVWNNV